MSIDTNRLIIIGIGETSQLAYEYFNFDSDKTIVAFAADGEYLNSSSINGLPAIPFDELERTYPPSDYQAFVAISSTNLNRDRRNAYRRLKKMGYQLASYISSRAFVWPNVEFGENCFILENNVLQPFSKIGNNVTLWSGNHVGHRSLIQDHCFISSHCVISGFCEIGESTFLGVNCTIEDHVKVGVDNFIGAGSLIRKHTREGSIYQRDATERSKVETSKLFKISVE